MGTMGAIDVGRPSRRASTRPSKKPPPLCPRFPGHTTTIAVPRLVAAPAPPCRQRRCRAVPRKPGCGPTAPPPVRAARPSTGGPARPLVWYSHAREFCRGATQKRSDARPPVSRRRSVAPRIDLWHTFGLTAIVARKFRADAAVESVKRMAARPDLSSKSGHLPERCSHGYVVSFTRRLCRGSRSRYQAAGDGRDQHRGLLGRVQHRTRE